MRRQTTMRRQTWKRGLAMICSAAMIASAVPEVAWAAETQMTVLASEYQVQDVAEGVLKAGSISASDDTRTAKQPFAAGTAGSNQFRIPALITMKDADYSGRLVAAADARYETGGDGGGLDTIASYSKDNGDTWHYSFPINFPDSTGYAGTAATTIIDPALVEGADGTIYCVADANPTGVTTMGGYTYPKAGTGYIAIDGTERLAVTSKYDNVNTAPTEADTTTYDYYVGDYNEQGYAPLVARGEDAAEESTYIVDRWLNLYKKDATGTYVALTQKQVNNQNQTIQQNLFYQASELHVYNTGYIWMVESKDGGETWDNPRILNTQIKGDTETALLVSPGQGITTSKNHIIIPFYGLVNGVERASFIFSKDNGETWKRVAPFELGGGAAASSESEMVELADGRLRMFFRASYTVGYIRYVDATYDEATDTYVWGNVVNTNISAHSGCNVSAIKYSEKVNGQDVILVTCPSTTLNNNVWYRAIGKVYAFAVQEDYSLKLINGDGYQINDDAFQYNCMTELNDGSIGILWEDAKPGDGSMVYEEISMEDILSVEVNLSVGSSQVIALLDGEVTIPEDNEIVRFEKVESIYHNAYPHTSKNATLTTAFPQTQTEELNLADAEVVFTASETEGQWMIKNPALNKYLANSDAKNMWQDAQALVIVEENTTKEGTYWLTPAANTSRAFGLYHGFLTFDSGGLNTTNSTPYTFWEASDEAPADSAIPGYVKATALVSGKSYLMTAVYDADQNGTEEVFLHLPINAGNVQAHTKLLAGSTAKTSELQIHAVGVGTTAFTFNGMSYKVNVAIPASGAEISQMFNDNGDNTWVFTGGEAVRGGFDQVQGARNYIGQFEEYIRWTKRSGNALSRQRYTINVGKDGYDVKDVVEQWDTLITPYNPKAAAYMVGVEDYRISIEDFKANLKTFITNALAMRENTGFAVIQNPVASADDATNQKAQEYSTAVNEVVYAFISDEDAYNRIVVVDHFSQTDNSVFTGTKMTDGKLNVQGHFEIGKQLSAATIKTTDNYPTNRTSNILKLEAEDTVSVFEKVQPTVVATADSLEVIIPSEASGTAWTYYLTVDGVTISDTVSTRVFTITDVPADAAYTLKVRTSDNEIQFQTVAGEVKAGNVAKLATQELDGAQILLKDKMASESSMTWLFMGDSITHAAQWTDGYDGTAQSFEKFLKDDLGRMDDVVINTGVSSATTACTVENIEQRLTKYQPDVVSIKLGANDCAVSGITPEVYKTNLETIIDAIQAKGATVILRTPTPAQTASRGEKLPEYIAKLEELVAEDPSIILVDHYTETSEAYDIFPYLWSADYMYTDGGTNGASALHPGPNGQLVMTRDFIEACGLWTEDSHITNLFYQMPFSNEASNAALPFITSRNQIALSVEALTAKTGLAVGSVTMTAVEKNGTKTYETTTVLGEDLTVLSGLKSGNTYDVTVTATLKDSAKVVTFATAEMTFDENAKATMVVQLNHTSAEDLAVGAEIGAFSVYSLDELGETTTYTLVDGEGATDNNKFEIKGSTLKIKEALVGDEVYAIRVQAINGDYEAVEQFTIKAIKNRVDLPIAALSVTTGDFEPDGGAAEGPVANVLDENPSTIWHTDWQGTSRENHWVVFEITGDYKVDGLRYQPRQGGGQNGMITGYEIYVSNDGENWGEPVATGTWELNTEWKTAEFRAIDAKYVRFVSTNSYSGNAGKVFASAAELRLTGEVKEEVHTHTFGEWTIQTPGTCTTKAILERACETCDEVETKEGEFGTCNKESVTEVPATCKAEGVKAHETCSACGKLYLEGEVVTEADLVLEKVAHTWTEWVVKNPATTKKNGSLVKTCTVCKHESSTKTIEKIKSVTLSKTELTYNGKAQKPSVKVKDDEGNIISSKYYKVSYASGCKKVGKYKVTITFNGNYEGKVTRYFTINPKATKLTSAKAAKKAISLKWNKQTKEVTGYQIQYATNKKFTKGVKNEWVKKAKTSSKTLKKLSAKKTYYVRIRTYKTVSKTKYYSAWSAVKKVKTK